MMQTTVNPSKVYRGTRMSTEKCGRKEKMVNSFLDTWTESVTQWGNEYISTNTPRTLDRTVAQVKEIISSISGTSNVKSHDFIRGIIFQGIEIGERNKENALVSALKEVGLDESQIEQILTVSQKYLVTKEDVNASL